MNTKMSILSRLLMVLAAILLVCAIFVPIWRIDLDAPQYPEGLRLLIFADKLGGNVDIINGLNHYIGMKTLHASDFIEFSILRYIIIAYALFALLVAMIGKKKISLWLLFAFIAFGIIAMADFWRWEYNYGHDLNPNAAIIVPGMAYQPPLIGFKQLLNFGAYSIPDIGGWLFIGSGVLMLLVVFMEYKLFNFFTRKKNQVSMAIFVLAVFFTSCSNQKTEPIKLNSDHCDNCKMTIADPRFACESLTSKGRVYKFDDIKCMNEFLSAGGSKYADASKYASDYVGNNELYPLSYMTFLSGGSIQSPMGGNTAAFSNKDSAATYQQKLAADFLSLIAQHP